MKEFAVVAGYGQDMGSANTFNSANLFLYLNHLHYWAKGEAEAGRGERYVSALDAANYTSHVFPHRPLPNGDIKLEVVPSPAAPTYDKAGYDHLLGSYVITATDLDAFRDLTLHWRVLGEVWQDPEMRPLDPFAAELLAERVSEFGTFLLKYVERHAQQFGVPSINDALVDNAMHKPVYLGTDGLDARWVKRDPARVEALFAAAGGRDPFKEQTAASGIGRGGCGMADYLAKHPPAVPADGASAYLNLQDYMGSGIAIGDYDGDGRPDVFAPGDGCNRLYHNLGNGKLEDATAATGFPDTDMDARQALFVDVDNDGANELFVVHSQGPSRLFKMGADRKWQDVTAASGIATLKTAHVAVFFDYDNDGLLDLYVGTYGPGDDSSGGRPAIGGKNGTPDQLYKNLGKGRFQDVSKASGLGKSTTWALAAGAFDFNHDGLADLLVANDWGQDELYVNRGNGRFEEAGSIMGADDRGSGMNVSFTDVNGDGWLDAYVSVIDMFSKSLRFVLPRPDSIVKLDDRIVHTASYFSGNKLLVNDHGKGFTPREQDYFDASDKGWGWASVFFDYDDDGDDDLYLATGWIPDSLAGKQKNRFFINDGGKYVDATDKFPSIGYSGYSRAVAAADLDGDGHQDLILDDFTPLGTAGEAAQSVRYFVNTAEADSAAAKAHWLKVKLQGVVNNRAGVGAEVSVLTDDGRRQTQIVTCGVNYMAQQDTTLTFGVGTSTKVKRLEIRWPGRKQPQVVEGPLDADKLHEIREDAGAAKS
jgi:hypothetical protein